MIGRRLNLEGWERVDQIWPFSGETQLVAGLSSGERIRVLAETDPYHDSPNFPYSLSFVDRFEVEMQVAEWRETAPLDAVAVAETERHGGVLVAAAEGESASLFWPGMTASVSWKMQERPRLPRDLLHFSVHRREERLLVVTERVATVMSADNGTMLGTCTFPAECRVLWVSDRAVGLQAYDGPQTEKPFTLDAGPD